jgi:hypothetical protein
MFGGFGMAVGLAIFLIAFPHAFSRMRLSGLQGVPPEWIRKIGIVLLALVVAIHALTLLLIKPTP